MEIDKLIDTNANNLFVFLDLRNRYANEEQICKYDIWPPAKRALKSY